MKYKVLSPLKKDGIDYSVGSEIELTEEEAKDLIDIVEKIEGEETEEGEENPVETPKRRGRKKKE